MQFLFVEFLEEIFWYVEIVGDFTRQELFHGPKIDKMIGLKSVSELPVKTCQKSSTQPYLQLAQVLPYNKINGGLSCQESLPMYLSCEPIDQCSILQYYHVQVSGI